MNSYSNSVMRSLPLPPDSKLAKGANVSVPAGYSLVEGAGIINPKNFGKRAKRKTRVYPVSKGPLGPGASPQRNGHPDKQPIASLSNLNTTRASKRTVRRANPDAIRPKLTAEQKDYERKVKMSNTPPFTEAVPNPPLGPEAEERVEKNIAAAEETGQPEKAEGYVKQVEQAVDAESKAADAQADANDATPNRDAESVDQGSAQQGKAPPLQSQGE